MSQNRAMHDYVMTDLFTHISGVTSKSMFGGWGFYKDGIIFALIAEGQLYFKVDEQTRPNFEKLGSTPFLYARSPTQHTTMPYWILPESIMEDQKKLSIWVDQAMAASLRSKKAKPKRK